MRTIRFSPITAGALAVALLVVIAEVTLVRRSRRQTATVAAPVPSESILPKPAPAPPQPPAPSPTSPPAPPVVTQPAPDEVEAQAGTDRAAALQRRALLGAAQNQRLMQQVDEQLFVTSQMDELTRLAIRRINEDQARRLQGLLDAGRPDGEAADPGGTAALVEAERARRAARERHHRSEE
jgi:hypothetical protein